MKRILLFLLLAISVSGAANAQWKRLGPGRAGESLSCTLNKAKKKLVRMTDQARRTALEVALDTHKPTRIDVSSQQVLHSTWVGGGVPATSFQLPSSKQKGFMLPHELPYHAMPAGLQNEGFKPQIHNVAPAAILLDNDNLLQEMQRQEILSIKHDKLREKIYNSLNKLNSTEWETTITGYIIYNNEYEYEYEYILDAA